AQEADTGVGARADTRLLRIIGVRHRPEFLPVPGVGRLLVLGVGVERLTASGGRRGPAELRAGLLLVLLGGGPGDELPGGVLVLTGALDAPRPGVEPAGVPGLDGRLRDVSDLALDLRAVGLDR